MARCTSSGGSVGEGFPRTFGGRSIVPGQTSLNPQLQVFGQGLQGRGKKVAEAIVSAIVAYGLDDPATFLQTVGPIGPRAFLRELDVVIPEAVFEEIVGATEKLLSRAVVADRARRNSEAFSSPWLLDAVRYGRRQRDQEVAGQMAEQEAYVPEDLWRPAPAKKRRAGPDDVVAPGSLLEKDRKELGYWSRRFADTVRSYDFPAVLAAKETDDFERSLGELVGGSRSGTVRLRLRTWFALSRWLLVVKGRAWPNGSADIVDYLHARLAEGGKQTFPQNLSAAVRWMESRVGLAEQDKASNDALFKRCFEKATVEVEQGTSVKKAPRFPVAVIASMELGVLDGSVAPVLRVVMWSRLLKIYGSLRGDDLQRITPSGVTMASNGLTGRLARTKTTGGGKKVREVIVFVPSEAWVVEPRWLQVGFDLWVALAPWDRDHFFPRPLPDMAGFEKRHAGVADLSAMNSSALAHLGRPVRMEQGWGVDAGRWLPEEVVQAWTGHSERATVTSALASLGVGREERNPLGRWAPEASDQYVRTYKTLVRRLVGKFVAEVKGGGAWTNFDEEDAYLALLASIQSKAPKQTNAGMVKALSIEARSLLKELGGQGGKGEETRAEETEVLKSVAADLGEKGGETEEDGEGETDDKYVISISQRGTVYRLHKANGCWRARGLKFSHYVGVPTHPPNPTSYTSVCKDCWPKAASKDRASSSSSSSSSSSGSA